MAFRQALAVILHLHWQSISLKIDYVKEQGGAISHPFAAPIAPCSPAPCTQAKCCAHMQSAACRKLWACVPIIGRVQEVKE